jgi:D-alanine-D-alanine ligase
VDRAKGVALVTQLLKQFEQPVIVEIFVPGREVSYCFVEAPGKASLRSFAESVWGDDSDHFNHHLYDSAHKAEADTMQTVRSINDELNPRTAEAIERLLRFVGPLGYGRIDGKLNAGEFVFLEITPDAWLGSTGTFVNSFFDFGLSFDDVIARILLSGRLNHQDRSTNG